MEETTEIIKAVKHLAISSQGEIDVKAFELIGASTKVDDSTKIGMFGSGINYSIAYLLRNKIPFKVYSGEKEIKITTKVEDFRGKVFEKICINGRSTSFVVEMGLDWEPWFVIREIYANAIDEGDEQVGQTEEIKPVKGRTTFYIEVTEPIQEVLDNWELYFSEGRTDILFEAENGIKVYTGGNDLVVYRKGIRVLHRQSDRCCFHYDFPNIAINESRNINNEFSFQLALMEFWCRNATVELIKRLLKDMPGCYEERLEWSTYGYTLSEKWEKALKNRTIVEKETAGYYEDIVKANKPIHVTRELSDSILNKMGPEKHVAGPEGEKGIKKLEESEKEKYMLRKLQEFCNECEYEIKHPIYVVQFTRKGILGQANDEDNEIYLSREAFDSMELLIKAAMEENEHLVSGHGDNTRSFQDHWINLFLQEKMARFAYTV